MARKRLPYEEEFAIAEKVLAQYGGVLARSTAQYEAFTFRSRDVALIFYPHRTSAGNYHLRVRDNGSRDKKLADALMRKLDAAAGNNCTFTRKCTYDR